MGISICKFQLKGWLKQEPKVVRRLDKDRIEYVSTIVKISIPKVTPSKNGICQLGGYHVISVAVHGCAAEQIAREMADPNLRWHCKDLVEITGYLVPVPHKSSRRKNSLGRQLTSAYHLRTNNPQNIINYSACERKRTKAKQRAERPTAPQWTTIAPGRKDPSDKLPLGKAIEIDYYDFQ